MAANPLRGEAELQAGDAAHILRLGVHSMVLLEREFGQSLPKIMAERFSDPANLLVGDMLTLLWASMQKSSGGPSKDDVADIMDEAGLPACGAAIGELLAATFPADDEKAAEGNPQKASRPSTGER